MSGTAIGSSCDCPRQALQWDKGLDCVNLELTVWSFPALGNWQSAHPGNILEWLEKPRHTHKPGYAAIW